MASLLVEAVSCLQTRQLQTLCCKPSVLLASCLAGQGPSCQLDLLASLKPVFLLFHWFFLGRIQPATQCIRLPVLYMWCQVHTSTINDLAAKLYAIF